MRNAARDHRAAATGAIDVARFELDGVYGAARQVVSFHDERPEAHWEAKRRPQRFGLAACERPGRRCCPRRSGPERQRAVAGAEHEAAVCRPGRDEAHVVGASGNIPQREERTGRNKTTLTICSDVEARQNGSRPFDTMGLIVVGHRLQP